jgi:F-type H+-transporting ATPase subunit b
LKPLLPILVFAALVFTPLGRIAVQSVRAAIRPVPVHAQRQSTPEAQTDKNQPEKFDKNESEEDENDAYRKSRAVRALGAKIGLNANQSATAFQVVNFVVLVLLFGWLLAKLLPTLFRKRSSTIQKHLIDARKATEEANARIGSVEARLGKLDGQIAELRAQAEKDSAFDEQRIKASVEEEKQKILLAAEQEVTAATAQAHRQLQQYAAELAIEQAGRKLTINAETDHLLVQNFARQLGDNGGQN